MAENTFEIIIITILILAIVVLATLTVYYARRRTECFTWPSPWCFRDWICPGLAPDKQNRWDELISLGLAGVPRTTGICYPGPLSDSSNMPNISSKCTNAWKQFLCGGQSPTGGCVPSKNCTGPDMTGPCNVPYTQN